LSSCRSIESKKRCIAADSSSLILLQKTGMLNSLLVYSSLIIAGAVFAELTENEKSGADDFRKLLSDCVVRTIQTLEEGTMGAGERETIELYEGGWADYVLVDDKKAAIYCKKNKIPFINSLLLPKLLYFNGILTEIECTVKMSELFHCGYYSGRIWERARGFLRKDLNTFLL